MSVTLQPAPFDSHAWLAGDHLKVSGDIESTLVIPAQRPEDLGGGHTMVHSYYITLSDGTLLAATNDPDRPDFRIEVEGSGEAKVSDDGLSITLAGTINWVAVSSNQGGHSINLDALPLFDYAKAMKAVIDAEAVEEAWAN
jgi:hypothetical protein